MGVAATIWKPTLDCADLDGSTRFWGWLLDADVSHEDGSFRFLSGKDGVPVFCLQRVNELWHGKNRMHLDLTVTELEAAVEEITR